MARTDPTLDTLSASFPEFEDVDDEVFDADLLAAKRVVDDTWFEGDYTRALELYVAHLLSVSEFSGSGGAAISSESLGPLSLSYRAGSGDRQFDTTYAAEFRSILRRNSPAIALI